LACRGSSTLLRAPQSAPCGRSAAERDELAPPHSITLVGAGVERQRHFEAERIRRF
jgi:hypothetical protein